MPHRRLARRRVACQWRCTVCSYHGKVPPAERSRLVAALVEAASERLELSEVDVAQATGAMSVAHRKVTTEILAS